MNYLVSIKDFDAKREEGERTPFIELSEGRTGKREIHRQKRGYQERGRRPYRDSTP